MIQPVWILPQTVLAIHDAQLAEHGGMPGVRDMGLLESALHHPQNLLAYGDPIICDLSAAYAERIIKNHPFVDGNKRTAYVVTLLFLKINGFELIATKEERVLKFVQLADGQITVHDFSKWLHKNTKPMI